MDRVILTLAGGCLGLLAGLLLWGRADDVPRLGPDAHGASQRVVEQARAAGALDPEQDASHAASFERWSEQLARESARGEVLAEEVRSLRAQLLALEEPAPADEDATEEGEARPARDEDTAPIARRQGGWLDEAALLDAGFHPSELEALRARFEEIELERLFQRDQATREGWIDKPRFRREIAKLNNRYRDLRTEYGDDAYDWILYASGRTNRVETNLVMRDSPAEEAGLEAGDLIVAYAGTRIFSARELQNATKAAGDPGDTVAVDVVRDGVERRFYLPVGPLGVQLGSIKVPPPNTR